MLRIANQERCWQRSGNALGKDFYRLAATQTSSSGAIIKAMTLGVC